MSVVKIATFLACHNNGENVFKSQQYDQHLQRDIPALVFILMNTR